MSVSAYQPIFFMYFFREVCMVTDSTLLPLVSYQKAARTWNSVPHYTLHRLRHCPSANSRPLCSLEVILTVLHVLNI